MNDSDSVCVRAIYGSHSPFEIWNAQKIRSSNHKKTPRAPRTLDNDDDVRYIKAIYKGYIKAIERKKLHSPFFITNSSATGLGLLKSCPGLSNIFLWLLQ